MRELIEGYDLVLLILGLAAFGVVGFPKVLGRRPLSYPIIFVAAGALFFALPFGLTRPDPIRFRDATESLTELGVITSLMGAGLAINRPIGLKAWRSTWLLLAVTMPVTIAAITGLGWWLLGLTPAAAVLLGAVLAPTDPVLASDVQVPGPGSDSDDDEVRFALTSEAGLNDGLAFPFTNLAILVALHGVAPSGWAGEFLAIEVGYKIAVGTLGGIVVGRLLALAIFSRGSPLPASRDGLVALAATLIAYAGTELVGGYGFLAVFTAAVVIRNQERKHDYHEILHQFSDQIERLLSAVILILFGGALITGVLEPVGWLGWLVAIAIVLVVRPAAGMLGLAWLPLARKEKAAVSFFGIRGVGSFYYLAHASNEVEFMQIEKVWALTAMVVLISIVVHGITATPAMTHIDRTRSSPATDAQTGDG